MIFVAAYRSISCTQQGIPIISTVAYRMEGHRNEMVTMSYRIRVPDVQRCA